MQIQTNIGVFICSSICSCIKKTKGSGLFLNSYIIHQVFQDFRPTIGEEVRNKSSYLPDVQPSDFQDSCQPQDSHSVSPQLFPFLRIWTGGSLGTSADVRGPHKGYAAFH